MTIAPKIRTRFGENIGVELLIFPPYLEDNNTTFLTTDYAAGVTSLAVDNGNKFAINDYVVIGQIGGEKTEIVKISGVSATSVTVGTTSFAHNRGERITFIPYNQIEPQRSIDVGVSYSSLSIINIRPDSMHTFLQRASDSSTDYYRVRFYNSTTGLYSGYSDGLIATGYAENTVGAIIRTTLVILGEKIDDLITKEFLYEALNEARTDLDQTIGIERWSFRTSFDYDAGDIIAGQNTLSLPTTIRDPYTNKNILSLRLGKANYPVTYSDKTALNRWYEGVSKSTLNGSITTGSTSIILTSSGDFDESGTVTIAGESISDVLDVVSYATNTESTKTLGTVTGIQVAGHSSGSIVWQGASFGRPLEYTVSNGQIVFSQPFSDDLVGENITMDFYNKLVSIDSDSDILDEPNPKMFIPYLKWRIKNRRDRTLKSVEDSDFQKWEEKRKETIQREYSGQDLRIVMDLPC